MKAVAGLLVGWLLLAGCDGPAEAPAAPAPGAEQAPAAPSSGTGPRGTAPGTASTDGETLIASPPAGWIETGALETPTLRMAEYGPPDEPADTLQRLTFEAQAGQPLPDPIEFVLAVSRDLQARCKGFQDINIASGLENGYPTSVRLMICPEFRDSPHGQVVMSKAIQGNELFYTVTRRIRTPAVPPAAEQADKEPAERRQPLSAQAMAEWSTHMKSVRVCDSRVPQAHPCPD